MPFVLKIKYCRILSYQRLPYLCKHPVRFSLPDPRGFASQFLIPFVILFIVPIYISRPLLHFGSDRGRGTSAVGARPDSITRYGRVVTYGIDQRADRVMFLHPTNQSTSHHMYRILTFSTRFSKGMTRRESRLADRQTFTLIVIEAL
jgi:hypothetical protein